MPRRAITMLLALALAGCGGSADLSVRVRFPDDASRDRARLLRVMSIVPDPAAEPAAGCSPLLESRASPGDPFYAIEDMVEIDLPASRGAGPLRVEGDGVRLFFADASDQDGFVFLHGCVQVDAGTAGAKEVVIDLVATAQPCETDADCDNDDLWCNGTYVCADERCVLEERDCSDGDICTQDVCNEVLDRCEHPPVDEPPAEEGPFGDATCSDGIDNDCDGLEDGEDPACKTCATDADCDDLNPCTRDRCEQQRCSSQPAAEGTTCDDGQYCTVDDTCTGTGQCRGTPRDCSELEDSCNQATCDEEADSCVAVPHEDGTGCDDGLWCTVRDACLQGVCTGDARDCSVAAGPCDAPVCNEDQDACEAVPLEDGTPCNDGQYCTVGEYCTAGECGGGEPRDCSAAGGACVEDGTCDEQRDVCVGDPLPEGTACDDELYCTVDDACDGAGTCIGPARDCSALDDVCIQGVCNEEIDQCEQQPAAAGDACDDGLDCSVDDVCDAAGNCAGVPRDCSQLDDACNQGVCDESAGGCVQQPANQDQPCDDGRFCTVEEACRDGLCTGGGARDCSGEVPMCVEAICDDLQDQCVAGDPLPDGAACGERFCDGPDLVMHTCQAGACSGEELVAACDDGDACTGQESCDPQEGCIAGTPVDCDDGYPCTQDACDPESGACSHTPNAGGCPVLHIGPAADTCLRQENGQPVTACDFTGKQAVANAVLAAPAEGAVFLLYDDNGAACAYEGCGVPVPGNSYLGAAPGIDSANTIVSCEAGYPDDPNGILTLTADGVHVERLTLVNRCGSHHAVSAWAALGEPAPSSGGHLIENITAMSLCPEMVGHNSVIEPLALGPDTTVRNCHFFGYYENQLDLTNADNTRIIHNTFVFTQNCHGPIAAQGTQGLTLANNVFLSLTRSQPLFLEVDAGTDNLVLCGNLLEGFDELINIQADHVIEDNLLEPAEMESPLRPVFLADATQGTGSVVAGEGTSLDGAVIEGQTDILPGAFQLRSSLSLPRRSLLRVGDGSCGSHTCDIDAAVDNEIQKAVWSIWPGGTVIVHHADNAYAGNAVISWPLTLRGNGSQPEDVVLRSREEDQLLLQMEMWARHASVLTLLHNLSGPVTVERLTILVDAEAVTSDHAVRTETGDSEIGTGPWHRFSRLKIESINTGAGLLYAFYLGDHVLVDNSLVHGAFESCVRFGNRRETDDPTPATTGKVANFTCRLNGTGDHLSQAGLDMASVVDAVLVNLAIEVDSSASLMRAQRRSTGDTGATALDVPESYTLDSATHSLVNLYTAGFNEIDGTYLESNVDELQLADPFFVSTDDSHLDSGCVTALDNGVDPATVDPDLSAGTSLDGVDRQGRAIDRGAYEQGL